MHQCTNAPMYQCNNATMVCVQTPLPGRAARRLRGGAVGCDHHGARRTHTPARRHPDRRGLCRREHRSRDIDTGQGRPQHPRPAGQWFISHDNVTPPFFKMAQNLDLRGVFAILIGSQHRQVPGVPTKTRLESSIKRVNSYCICSAEQVRAQDQAPAAGVSSGSRSGTSCWCTVNHT